MKVEVEGLRRNIESIKINIESKLSSIEEQLKQNSIPRTTVNFPRIFMEKLIVVDG